MERGSRGVQRRGGLTEQALGAGPTGDGPALAHSTKSA